MNLYLSGGGTDYGDNGTNMYLATFPAGTNCTSFDIPVKDDNISEINETFNIAIVNVSLPFGVTLGNRRETKVIIIDNDSK